MSKQLILTAIAAVTLFGLFFFGRTVQNKPPAPKTAHEEHVEAFDIEKHIADLKKKLKNSQVVYLSSLESSVKRGDVHEQTHRQLDQLASFWRDTAQVFEPYAYYLSESAKLDNSEKSLTFAARLILENMRSENDPSLRIWKSELAASLFEKALQLNPNNDSLKIGLGSSYVFGKGMTGDAGETMKGVQTLLEVVRRDSNNMQAQTVLGIGGVISRQYDKAIERLEKVVKAEPNNLEAMSWLADAYAAAGNKANAIKWYERSKKLVNNPEYSKEVNERIKALQ
jgi:tetratricopeptide (TPR) repeat protein